jgi:hypothetical protein
MAVESGISPRLARPLTRSAIKPKLLFPPGAANSSTLEDEEADTDVEDHHMDSDDLPETPTDAIDSMPRTPRAPKFAPAMTPPDSKRTTRLGIKPAGDDTPRKDQAESSSSHKRYGGDLTPVAPKRTRV